MVGYHFYNGLDGIRMTGAPASPAHSHVALQASCRSGRGAAMRFFTAVRTTAVWKAENAAHALTNGQVEHPA